MHRLIIYLLFFFCICSCGNDDGGGFTCQKGEVTLLLDGLPFEHESVLTTYASQVEGTIYKRAIEITATRADGQTISVLLSSIVDAFNNNCVAEKEYFERLDLSYCKNGNFTQRCDGVLVEYNNQDMTLFKSNENSGAGTATITLCDYDNRSITGRFTLFAINGAETHEITGSFNNLCFQ